MTDSGLPLLLLTDSRFPAGGYAHSGGLEAAVEAGLELADTPAFLAGRLYGVSLAEASLAVAAARAAGDRALGALATLDMEAIARCASPPLRAVAGRLGAQLLRTACSIWPGDQTLATYCAASTATPRPVAFGVVASVAGLSTADTANAYLYDEAMCVATAAVRLLPVDSTTALRWVIDARTMLEQLAEIAASFPSDPRLLPSGFIPALEIGSIAHAAREGKLFAS